MAGDTKQAEKEYLARTGSSVWERTKPFSPPGNDTLDESAQLLHDFAVAMLTLRPGPDDLILDLGAGGCWCSDLLGQLNRQAVAVDISLDMLRAGRLRPNGAAIRAVAGDLEQLPFGSGTFDKAVCLNAIHHVPDIPRAVAEIARVLTDDGVALFSEPGKGHADKPVSTAATRNYGVLEQDILIDEFARVCHTAGFADVRVKALSYAVPAFDITPEDWHTWSRLARSRRPMRALGKMAHALTELLGFGKHGALFEEAFGMSVVRILSSAMEDHPILVASKVPSESAASGPAWRAELLVEAPHQAARSAAFRMNVLATNRGSAVWKAESRSGTGHVMLGVHLLDPQGRFLKHDLHRERVPADVAPGQTTTFDFDCVAPEAPGRYVLKLDLVAEGVTWFETAGSPTASRPIDVI